MYVCTQYHDIDSFHIVAILNVPPMYLCIRDGFNHQQCQKLDSFFIKRAIFMRSGDSDLYVHVCCIASSDSLPRLFSMLALFVCTDDMQWYSPLIMTTVQCIVTETLDQHISMKPHKYETLNCVDESRLSITCYKSISRESNCVCVCVCDGQSVVSLSAFNVVSQFLSGLFV